MPPQNCFLCGKANSEQRTLHGFPVHNPKLLKIWKERLNLHSLYVVTSNIKICSNHFERECFKVCKSAKLLLPGSIPTLLLQPKRICFYCKATQESKPGISLRLFPLNKPEHLKQWLKNINLKNFVPDKNTMICSDHFDSSCFRKIKNKQTMIFKEEAIPTIFLNTVTREDSLELEDESTQECHETEVELSTNNEKDSMENRIPSVFDDPLLESADLTESEEECDESVCSLELSFKDPIGCCSGCDALKTKLFEVGLEKEALDKKCNEFAQKEIELKKRIISLELELQQKTDAASKRKIKTLENDLQKKHLENARVKHKLETIFSKNQIEILWESLIQRYFWTEIDIYRSINLYSVGAKTYELLKKNHFPLPSVQTLQEWAHSIELPPGVLIPVAKILSSTTHMDQNEKVCVLSFDVMKLNKSSADKKSASYVQVAMLTGLMSKWEQPIFYSFEPKMTEEVLYSILGTVEDCGYTIVAVVGDLGGANSTLFIDLKLSLEKPWFLYNDDRIFVFPDVPHLLEVLINNFFDHGFLIKGKEIKKNIVSELLSCTPSEQNVATQKTNCDDINISGTEHKQAAKQFSQSIAKLISSAAKLGLLKEANWEKCCQMFKLISDWFDIMNVSTPKSNSRESLPAYGQALKSQNEILNKMSQLMGNMRVIGKTSVLPFQKGIAHANVALKLLYKDMGQRFGFNYVLTSRLHKDALEKTLNFLGTKGGLQELPNEEEFHSRLTCHILGRNKDDFSKNAEHTQVLQEPLTASILKCLWSVEEDNTDENEEEDTTESDRVERLDENTDDTPPTKKTCIRTRRGKLS